MYNCARNVCSWFGVRTKHRITSHWGWLCHNAYYYLHDHVKPNFITYIISSMSHWTHVRTQQNSWSKCKSTDVKRSNCPQFAKRAAPVVEDAEFLVEQSQAPLPRRTSKQSKVVTSESPIRLVNLKVALGGGRWLNSSITHVSVLTNCNLYWLWTQFFFAIVHLTGPGKSNTTNALLFPFNYCASKMPQGRLSEIQYVIQALTSTRTPAENFKDDLEPEGPTGGEAKRNQGAQGERGSYHLYHLQ